MISTRRYTDADAEPWNSFVKTAKNGAFLFDRNYMDYHRDRFSDHSLVFEKKGKIIAVLPGNEANGEIYSHGGLSFGGLVMHYDLKAAEVLEIFEQMLSYYRQAGFKALTYKAIPAIFHQYPAAEDLYALFRNEAVLVRRDISSAVDLKKPIRFSETKRQFVTKCRNRGFTVAAATSFEEFWQLLTEVLSKFGTSPVHSLSEIQLLAGRFPDQVKLFECRDNNQLLAGILVYDYNNVVHTQYMANSVEGRNIGALDYINHTLITGVYKDREYFNFGISTEDSGKVLNTGLIQQKEMMGGRGIVYDFYKMTL